MKYNVGDKVAIVFTKDRDEAPGITDEMEKYDKTYGTIESTCKVSYGTVYYLVGIYGVMFTEKWLRPVNNRLINTGGNVC